MDVEVIEPHGFCAGVRGALAKALSLLSSPGAPVFCLHELVHNERVTGDLASRGMVFVDSVEVVPEGGTLLFSAHGVSPEVRRRAARRRLKTVDATCPFVRRAHEQVKAFAARGLPVVIVGTPGHAEADGLAGESGKVCFHRGKLPPKGARIGVVSQTTMNADDVARIVADLRKDYDVETSAEVCLATKARQNAVRAFVRRNAGRRTGVLVLGSANSSNTLRLAEIAAEEGARAVRAGTAADLNAADFGALDVLGVTAGASTPEAFVAEIVDRLQKNAEFGILRHSF